MKCKKCDGISLRGSGCRYCAGMVAADTSECHCGKDGHALNSMNCPVHGYEIRMKMARDLANWEI